MPPELLSANLTQQSRPNLQHFKPVVFLYINNEQSKKEIKILFTVALKKKKKKNSAINLTKEVKDLYTEDYKMLPKEIKEVILK